VTIVFDEQVIAARRRRLSEARTGVANAGQMVSRVQLNLSIDQSWRFSGSNAVNERLSALSKRLQAQEELLGNYVNFLDTAAGRYSESDRNLRNRAGEALYRLKQMSISSLILTTPPRGLLRGAKMGAIIAATGMFGIGIKIFPPGGVQLGGLKDAIKTGIKPKGEGGRLSGIGAGKPTFLGGVKGLGAVGAMAGATSSSRGVGAQIENRRPNFIRRGLNRGRQALRTGANTFRQAARNGFTRQNFRNLSNIAFGSLMVVGGLKFPPLAVLGGFKIGDGVRGLATGTEQNSLKEMLNFATGDNRVYNAVQIGLCVADPIKCSVEVVVNDILRDRSAMSATQTGAIRTTPVNVGP